MLPASEALVKLFDDNIPIHSLNLASRLSPEQVAQLGEYHALGHDDMNIGDAELAQMRILLTAAGCEASEAGEASEASEASEAGEASEASEAIGETFSLLPSPLHGKNQRAMCQTACKSLRMRKQGKMSSPFPDNYAFPCAGEKILKPTAHHCSARVPGP